jgi:uncharacterized protein
MPTETKPNWPLRKGKDPDADPTNPGHGYLKTVDAGMVFERDIEVALRDGTKIYIDVFRPDKPGRFPVVLGYAPFGKHPHIDWDVAFPGADIPPGISKYTAFEACDPVVWTANDYVVVNADPRGIRYSEGIAEFMTAQEGQDEYDLIEWLAVQDWSNGNVGTNGVSYLSMSAYRVAELQPPHLKAVILWEALNDFYRDVKFHGGIPARNTHGWMQMTSWSKQSVEDLESGAREHPLYDDFWTCRVADLSKFEVPVFVVSSWANHGIHTRGTMEAWRELASKDKWLDLNAQKEWAYFYRADSVARQMRFFDRYLKGEQEAIQEWPAVRVEVRERLGSVIHREETSYPIPGTEFRPFYLDGSSGALEPSPVASEGSIDYDARRGTCDFDLHFSERTELIGPAALRLSISLRGSDDADLFVALRKFDASGSEVHFEYLGYFDTGSVALGWLRLSHRALDEARSTPERPRPLHTREERIYDGHPVAAEIAILDSGTVFEAGESLRLSIQGHDFVPEDMMSPRHTELRNDGQHMIHYGGRYQSRLLLPFVPSANNPEQV